MRAPVPHSRWLRLALVLAVIAGSAALVWWRGPDWGNVGDAFRAVSWSWIWAAVGLNLLSVLARSFAWRTVIDQSMPPPHPRYRFVFSAFCVGLLANAVLPGRIGEIARVGVLARHLPRGRGVWATLVGTVFAHRVFDLVAVIGLIAFVALTADIPAWALTGVLVVVVACVLLLGFSILGARRHHESVLEGLSRVRYLLTMARHGLGVMHAPFPAAVAIFFQCIGWALQLFAVYATMRGFRIDEPLAAAGLVLLLMNAATIVTLWPGNVGLLQAAVALPLVGYGIAYAHGFAFGIGLQAIEVSVGVGVGLIFLAREGLSFAMLRQMPEEVEDEAAADPEPAQVSRESRASRSRARVPG
jgi:uncharacterized protein (TIRG00374 family)